MGEKHTGIDAYLAALSDDKRAALEHIRQIVKAEAPEAVEAISYQLCAFRLHGKPLVAFGATANHCAFHPMTGHTVAAYRDELKGFRTSKGTIRFLPETPIPDDLLRRMIRSRIAENAG